jgi:hypothetical protein
MRIAQVCALVALTGCSFDSERPAPYVAPPTRSGVCGTTETLLPNLLGFVRAGKMEPLRDVLERRLLPSAGDPDPDPSLRSLLGALVDLATGLGLERTVSTASIAAGSAAISALEPLVLTTLRFMDGKVDGRARYESTEAIATLIDRCEPEHLLEALERILLLRSPSSGGRFWLSVLGDEIRGVVRDPALEPFLESFENDAERGKPAIRALLVQILGFLADERFDISRVRTLLESAVYPVVSEELRMKIERLVDMLGEATSPSAGVLVPLQRAIRCLNAEPDARRELIDLLYDMLTSDEFALEDILTSVEGLVGEAESEKLLTFLADLSRILREEPSAREPILGLAVIMLSRPEVEKLLPVLTELIEADVVGELLTAVAKLLGGCGRDPG